MVFAAVLLVCLLASLLRAHAGRPPLRTAKSFRVVDGDTVRIDGCRCRLRGIDAPELGDAGGFQAKEQLEKLISGTELRYAVHGHDRHGRKLVTLVAESGMDVNALMVLGGHARAYRRYTRAYAGEEIQAKSNRRGNWSSGNFTHPELMRIMRG